MKSRWFVWTALASLAVWGLVCSNRHHPPAVVARWDGLVVSADDVEAAVAGTADAAVVRGDPARLHALAVELLADEALAREARRTLPDAALVERAALRRALAAADVGARPTPGATSTAVARSRAPEEAGGARIDHDAIERLGAGLPVEPDHVVVALGDERVTADEARVVLARSGSLGPTGADGFGRRLAGELALSRHARERGLDRSPSIRLRVRQLLIEALRRHEDERVLADGVSEAAVADAYKSAPGDYTEPRRLRVSALVSRDPRKAERWAATLAAARHPGNAFEKLLAESEDASARVNRGDLGWIDGRSAHLPEPFKRAVLAMTGPGAVSGVLDASDVHNVLFCTDVTAPELQPLAQVAPSIRARIVSQRRREAWLALRERVTGTIVPTFDQVALNELVRTGGKVMP